MVQKKILDLSEAKSRQTLREINRSVWPEALGTLAIADFVGELTAEPAVGRGRTIAIHILENVLGGSVFESNEDRGLGIS